MKQYFKPVIFIALAMYCSFSWSQSNDVIRISADDTYFNSKELFSVYQGNVTLSQEKYNVSADKLEISEVDKMAFITGNPLLIQFTAIEEEPATISAEEAVLDFNEKTFQLLGSVNLTQGGFSMVADQVLYKIETGELHATQNPSGNGQQNRTTLVADDLF